MHHIGADNVACNGGKVACFAISNELLYIFKATLGVCQVKLVLMIPVISQ